jgi:hypothetical protein
MLRVSRQSRINGPRTEQAIREQPVVEAGGGTREAGGRDQQ